MADHIFKILIFTLSFAILLMQHFAYSWFCQEQIAFGISWKYFLSICFYKDISLGIIYFLLIKYLFNDKHFYYVIYLLFIIVFIVIYKINTDISLLKIFFFQASKILPIVLFLLIKNGLGSKLNF
jgi:hypothetical protein